MKEWIQRYRAILFVLLIVALLAGLVLMQLVRLPAPPPLLGGFTPAPSPGPSPTPRPLRVYVSGAVHQPDVYVLPPDSIVKDALQAAGGATLEADLDRINLAEPLADGSQVYVPHKGEAQLPIPLRSQPVAGAKVNINTAASEELDVLPGIGPATAQRIVDYRQSHGRFGKIEDLMDVPGIGPATFDKLRELITTD